MNPRELPDFNFLQIYSIQQVGEKNMKNILHGFKKFNGISLRILPRLYFLHKKFMQMTSNICIFSNIYQL